MWAADTFQEIVMYADRQRRIIYRNFCANKQWHTLHIFLSLSLTAALSNQQYHSCTSLSIFTESYHHINSCIMLCLELSIRSQNLWRSVPGSRVDIHTETELQGKWRKKQKKNKYNEIAAHIVIVRSAVSNEYRFHSASERRNCTYYSVERFSSHARDEMWIMCENITKLMW